MFSTPQNADDLLTQLEAAKNRFDHGHAAVIAKLIARISRLQFDNPRQVIRFHECLLFLRAFPHAASHVLRLEHLLRTFHKRIERLRSLRADMTLFDDFDTSGISGTTMQDILSFDVAQWFARRYPDDSEIAWNDYWDDYQSERNRGTTWPRFIPLLEEDANVEANIPWLRWLDAARGRQRPLAWLVSRFARLPLPSRQRAELYDSLRLPLRWKVENSSLSRTCDWRQPRQVFVHNSPLIRRSEVSLARELALPAPRLEKLSAAAGESVMNDIREVMAVRYRELYGTTLGDPRSVVRVNLGRGAVMYFWGLPPSRRLPLRAYLAGYTLKNGVPVNYIEAIGLCEWIEVGFNTFYTYRQGETAWIYAQALRCLRALAKADCISIYPYQIGQNNDEAIDSGAFWFYRKLGFRSGRADLRQLCDEEEKKIAGGVRYRTPPRTLKRLAEAHMFYQVPGTEDDQKDSGAWDNFSVRNLGLQVNRRMATRFDGDSKKIRWASTLAVTRALQIDPDGWNEDERQSLENWSLVWALIPAFGRGPDDEKHRVARMIRAKASPNETVYLRHTQKVPRLRAELLKIGSFTLK
jgi:hypothetical protein